MMRAGEITIDKKKVGVVGKIWEEGSLRARERANEKEVEALKKIREEGRLHV